MKRIYTYILLITCTLFMTSCQKDFDGVLDAEIQSYESNGSKVYVDGSGYACWNHGDRVNINGTNSKVMINGDKATITTTLSTSPSASNPYKAVYPAEYASYDGTNGNMVINLPQEQSYREVDGKQIVKAPMVAYTEGTTLNFYNVCSLMKITVPGASGRKISRIEVADASANLYGKLTYSQDVNITPTVNSIAEGGKMVALNISSSYGNLTNEKSFYIVVPPLTTAPKLTIKVFYTAATTNTANRTGEDIVIHTFKMKENVADAGSLPMNKIFSLTLDMNKGTKDINPMSWEGKGTAVSPYLIQNKTDLRYLETLSKKNIHFSGVHFQQTADISIASSDDYRGIEHFCGTYNGKDNSEVKHMITIGSDNPNYYGGVFKEIGNNASIINLNTNVNINKSTVTYGIIGGIVNKVLLNDGESANITNCNVTGTMTLSLENGSAQVGGIVGGLGDNISTGELSIENCVNTSTIIGHNAGGILGVVNSCKVNLKNCANHGNITASYTGGGLVALLVARKESRIEINNSYSYCDVKGVKKNGTDVFGIGGIIGYIGSDIFAHLNNVYVGGNIDKDGGGAYWIGGAQRIHCTNVYSPSATNNGKIVQGDVVTKYHKDTWKLSDGSTLVEALNANRGSNEMWVGTGQPKLDFE